MIGLVVPWNDGVDRTSVPSPETLREKAAKIVARRDYDLSGGPDDSATKEILLQMLDSIADFFRWFFSLTAGLPEFLRWIIVIGLTLLLVLLIGHIIYTLVTSIRAPKRLKDPDFDLRRRGQDPVELEQLADNAAGEADYIGAIRYLFRASVVRLEAWDKRSHRPGTTNRELLRRYRDKQLVNQSLSQMVEMIDRKWYGDEVCSHLDYQTCQHAHADICRTIGEPMHAVRA